MYEIAGRQFRTPADYDAAKRDAVLIEQLKNKYDLDRAEELERLIRDLKEGKYRFRTILGDDLLEETEALLKERRAEAEREGTRSRRGRKTAGQSGRQDKRSRAAGGKHPAEKQKLRLEDYDARMQKEILAELRRRERIRKLILAGCMLVAAGCFLYLGIYSYQTKRLDDYASIQQNLKGAEGTQTGTEAGTTVTIHYDDKELAVPEVLEEYKTLYSLNKKLIGWVKIDDTYIDYPVLQTSNNEYYLKHNFDQEEDRNGSIFLDKDCCIFPRSMNLIVYGHHMRSGRMFGQLTKYSSEDFYKEHKLIQFDTIYEKGIYEVMYVFRSKIYEENEIVFKYYQFIDAASEAEFDSNMREMAEMSLYDTGVTAGYGDELLTLSTCDYYTDYGRFVVVAKRVK